MDYEEKLKENSEAMEDALSDSNATYGQMADAYKAEVEKQQGNLDAYEKEQRRLQQEQTDFAISKIEREQEQAEKDYTKEQQAAYGDYKRQTDPYGVNAERMADAGLSKSGYSESSNVAMYTAYQNRVASARASFEKAKLAFSDAMKEAKLTNDVNLAKLAADTLEKSLTLSMESVVYLGNLELEKAAAASSIKQTYYNREQDILEAQREEKAAAQNEEILTALQGDSGITGDEGNSEITGDEGNSEITGDEGDTDTGDNGNIETAEDFITPIEINKTDKYLSGLVAEGTISEEEGMAILENEIEKFKNMVRSPAGWSVVYDGGINIFGIDRNAIVKAPNGEQYSLKNLMNILVDFGMSKSEARKLVKALQDNLGGI